MPQAPAAKTVIRTGMTAALAITALAITAAAPAHAATVHAARPAQRGDANTSVTGGGGVGSLLSPATDLTGGLVDGAIDGVTGGLPI
jgi:hypothetical protein